MPKAKHYKTKQLSPSCRVPVMYRLDLRTVEGRTISAIRARLVEYVGGNPNPKQILLIERVAWISLRIALKEQKLMAHGEDALTTHDNNYYLAWSNTLNKLLKQLHPPATEDTLRYENILAEVRG